MGEPINYLREDTYRPKWLRDGEIELTLNAVENARSEILAAAKELAQAKRIYLIGSGASYSVQFPIRYVAEKYTDLPVLQYSGWEYLERMPTTRKGDLCIFISHSGKTSEIVKGVEWAKSKGAKTVAVAQQPDSLINRMSDFGFSYVGRSITVGKLAVLYHLSGMILQERGYEIGGKMMELVDSLLSTISPMISKARENGRVLGLRHKDDDEMYVVGGGINWGLAYEFATCFLQELCWVHATPANYSEFMHGPIELFTPGRAAIFLKGRGEERDLENSIINWCVNNGVRAIVLDSQGLDVDNLITPFTLIPDFHWFTYYLSLARNRDMESWRYYDKVKF
jgi:fructoselysine-6-P-deglycase FrlB-like protein